MLEYYRHHRNAFLAMVNLRNLLLTQIFIVGVIYCSSAQAQSDPITESDYEIDLHQGMIMGSPRVIGLGGAYTGLAQGVVALPFNSAAVVQRPHFSSDYFDWDLGFDVIFPPTMQSGNFDIDNNGVSSGQQYMSLSGGFLLQFGRFGVGVYVMGHTYQFDAYSFAFDKLEQSTFTTRIVLGYSLFEHQLLLGASWKQGVFQLNPLTGNEDSLVVGDKIFEQKAFSPEFGIIWRPDEQFFRVGLSFTAPEVGSESQLCIGSECPSGFILPRGVSMPWVLSLGATYKLGGMPLNQLPTCFKSLPGPVQADKNKTEGYTLLMVVQLDVVGAHENAIGSDGFISQLRELSGESITLVPRLGLESQVWPGWVKLRAGFYWEPSRFENSSGRAHGTIGMDLRLFRIDWMSDEPLFFSTAFDMSRQYQNLSFAVGLWR